LEAPPVDPLFAQIAHEDGLVPLLKHPGSEAGNVSFAKSFSAVLLALPFSLSAFSDPLPPDLTYRPLPTLPLW
jgi:hypothetical protein